MLKQTILLANKFEKKLKKLANPMPADTDQLEVTIQNVGGVRLSLGKWSWSKIKVVCPQLSMLPGVEVVEAYLGDGETVFSWTKGILSSGFK